MPPFECPRSEHPVRIDARAQRRRVHEHGAGRRDVIGLNRRRPAARPRVPDLGAQVRHGPPFGAQRQEALRIPQRGQLAHDVHRRGGASTPVVLHDQREMPSESPGGTWSW